MDTNNGYHRYVYDFLADYDSNDADNILNIHNI